MIDLVKKTKNRVQKIGNTYWYLLAGSLGCLFLLFLFSSKQEIPEINADRFQTFIEAGHIDEVLIINEKEGRVFLTDEGIEAVNRWGEEEEEITQEDFYLQVKLQVCLDQAQTSCY